MSLPTQPTELYAIVSKDGRFFNTNTAFEPGKIEWADFYTQEYLANLQAAAKAYDARICKVTLLVEEIGEDINNKTANGKMQDLYGQD